MSCRLEERGTVISIAMHVYSQLQAELQGRTTVTVHFAITTTATKL